jgi:hypothetical protein
MSMCLVIYMGALTLTGGRVGSSGSERLVGTGVTLVGA